MATQVGFSTPKRFNPVSWIVKKVTKSTCSHAWFLYHDKDFDMPMVMEAHELGFRLTPYDRFQLDNEVVTVCNPKMPIDVGLVMVAKKYLATPYDWGGLFGMAIVKLGRWLKRSWNNPWRSSRSVFCSEAVCIAMKASPGYESFNEDPATVDPELLMEHLQKHEL